MLRLADSKWRHTHTASPDLFSYDVCKRLQVWQVDFDDRLAATLRDSDSVRHAKQGWLSREGQSAASAVFGVLARKLQPVRGWAASFGEGGFRLLAGPVRGETCVFERFRPCCLHAAAQTYARSL